MKTKRLYCNFTKNIFILLQNKNIQTNIMTRSPAKGWAKASPKKGKERIQLMKKCGKDCFLLPSKMAFPVCARLNGKKNCIKDCRGILSAKIRARQWKYKNVAKRSQRIGKKIGCSWVKSAKSASRKQIK